jgi:hypothetical protein
MRQRFGVGKPICRRLPLSASAFSNNLFGLAEQVILALVHRNANAGNRKSACPAVRQAREPLVEG